MYAMDQLQSGGEETDAEESNAEEENDDVISQPPIVSKYFDSPRHAGMAKRKTVGDDVISTKRRQHEIPRPEEGEQIDSASEISELNDDS